MVIFTGWWRRSEAQEVRLHGLWPIRRSTHWLSARVSQAVNSRLVQWDKWHIRVVSIKNQLLKMPAKQPKKNFGGECNVHSLRSASGATRCQPLDREHCGASTRFISCSRQWVTNPRSSDHECYALTVRPLRPGLICKVLGLCFNVTFDKI